MCQLPNLAPWALVVTGMLVQHQSSWQPSWQPTRRKTAICGDKRRTPASPLTCPDALLRIVADVLWRRFCSYPQVIRIGKDSVRCDSPHHSQRRGIVLAELSGASVQRPESALSDVVRHDDGHVEPTTWKPRGPDPIADDFTWMPDEGAGRVDSAGTHEALDALGIELVRRGSGRPRRKHVGGSTALRGAVLSRCDRLSYR
jgi:hypothetical protein